MFIDRFIRFPTDMVNDKQKDLTGDDGAYESFTYILPFEICEYHETKYDEKEGTQIYLKSGRGFMINMTVTEFENLINDFTNDKK